MIKIAVAIIAILGSSGCEYFYLHYTDCRYYDDPRFDRISLNRPVLNQVYSDQVRISFDDDGHIDSYDYWVEFSGALPPGITYYQENRNIYYQGAATSQGTYSFTINAGVRYSIHDRSYYGNYREYCSYRTAQNYQLIVEVI